MVKKIIKILLSVMLLLMCLPAFAAKIAVTTDRTQIQDNESFTLEYSSDSSVDDDPDFTPLEKNFHIVSRSQSSNIQFINGRMDRKMSWVLVLMPKSTGDFAIPAISFGSDKSEALSIKVTKASGGQSGDKDDLIYMEAFADKSSAYVQSQIIYTLRIYHAVRFRNASLSELELSDKDAAIEKLEENKKYTKFINGRRYQVFEKRYAIFPQTTGELVIEPSVLETQYVESMRTLRNKRIVAEKIKIDVKPVPQVMKNKKVQYWLPASGLKLEEKWSGDTNNLQLGEPLTRTVTLSATGLLSSALPDLTEKESVVGLKQYPDQPSLDNKITESGYVGIRQEKIAYIPSVSGKVTLPEIEILWWDTKNNKLQKAKLPSQEILVTGDASQTPGIGSQPDVETMGEITIAGESNGALSGPAKNVADNVSIAGFSKSGWFWASILLLILWVATIVLWLNARRTVSSPTANEKAVGRESFFSGDALKTIKTACDSNDPQAAKEALIRWGQSLWPNEPPTSLGHISERVSEKLSRDIDQLNSVLYKSGDAQWDGSSLWRSLSSYADEQQKKESKSSSKIKPLFRLAASQES